MKVSDMAKKLEEVLNKPKTLKKKEETPIIHAVVNLTERNIGNYTISFGGGSRRNKKDSR